jgi:hypothetical protein
VVQVQGDDEFFVWTLNCFYTFTLCQDY